MAQRIPRARSHGGRAAGRERERGDGYKKKKTPLLRILHTGRDTERKRKKKEGRAKACPWLPVLVLLVVRAPLVLHGLQHADVETTLALSLSIFTVSGFGIASFVKSQSPEPFVSSSVPAMHPAPEAPGILGAPPFAALSK